MYKGSLLALVGVSNGSIQFAAYESIKRYRADLKRKLYEKQGKEWKAEDEKLVSGILDRSCRRMISSATACAIPSNIRSKC